MSDDRALRDHPEVHHSAGTASPDARIRLLKFRTLPFAATLVLGILLATNPMVVQAAGMITGRDIKDGTVTTRDIRDRTLRAADFKPGQLPRGERGPQGEMGPAGPQGPSGVVDSAFASGEGGNPKDHWSFLAPPVEITVPSGGEAFVVSSKAFGSTAPGGAQDLVLAICYEPVEQNGLNYLQFVGEGVENNRVAQDTRTTLTLSAVLSGQPAGKYRVGLCGLSSDSASWNWNDAGYTSAMVYRT